MLWLHRFFSENVENKESNLKAIAIVWHCIFFKFQDFITFEISALAQDERKSHGFNCEALEARHSSHNMTLKWKYHKNSLFYRWMHTVRYESELWSLSLAVGDCAGVVSSAGVCAGVVNVSSAGVCASAVDVVSSGLCRAIVTGERHWALTDFT